jgi:hypothetical protein
MADPAAVILDEIRERAKGAADLNVDLLAQFVGPDTRSIGGWIAASALDVPPLLAAVEAALGHHAEAVIKDMPEPFHYCKTCSGHPKWPCPEVRAIRAALTRGAT